MSKKKVSKEFKKKEKLIEGRPEVVNMEQLAQFCRLKPTLEDCAAFFKTTGRTIERTVKRHTGLTFVEFRNQNMVHTRHRLVREAITQATQRGNTAMLIFCLKNVCGWKDKVETESSSEIQVNITKDDAGL